MQATRPRLVAGILGASFACACLMTAPVSSAEPLPRVRLVWARTQDAESCAPASQIRSEVAASVGSDAFSDDARRTIEVVIDRHGETWTARIQVRDEDGLSLGIRELTSPSFDCKAIQDAAVLAVALSINPNARLVVPSSPPAPPSSSAPPPMPPPAASSALPPQPIAPPVTRFAPRPAPVPLAPPAQDLDLTPASLTLRGGFTVGLVPGLSPTASLSGAVPVASGWSVTAQSMFVREAHPDDTRFSFGLSAFGAGLCRQTTGTLAVGACASLWLGAHWAVVHDLRPTRPGSRLFSAGSLTTFGRVAVLGQLHLELAGDIFAPFYRREFAVTGWDTPVWRQPAVAVALHGGLGLHFP